MMPRYDVPVDVFRDRFEELRAEGRIDARIVAEHFGWYRMKKGKWQPDQSRALQALGIYAYWMGHGYGRGIREGVKYATAVRLAEILDMDYTEVGV